MKWMTRLVLVGMVLWGISGCATVKPLELKPIEIPKMETIHRIEIPRPVEGTDYFFNEKGNVEYTLTGQNKLTAKIMSEQLAWDHVEHMKVLVLMYSDIAQKYQTWVIETDMQRQIAENSAREEKVKTVISQILGLIAVVLAVGAL